MKQEGALNTLDMIRAKLDESMALGYSSAGIVLECGDGVHRFKPGDRVATAGPHAGVVTVNQNFCARMPEEVSFGDAAFASIASIALQGARLSQCGLGDRVLVMGLGLVGQMAVQILRAQGCRVFGTDVDELRTFTEGQGVDAVVITATTDSNQPIEFAAEVSRIKGRIVLVGVVGLTVPRQPFFDKELEFTVSSSSGPGRLDDLYAVRGQDYPFGHVRWTCQRNMQTALELMADGQLKVAPLITHRFAIERATEAYDLVRAGGVPHMGIVLEYSAPPAQPTRRVSLKSEADRSGKLGLSLIGAGNFARLVLLRKLGQLDGCALRGLCAARGMGAEGEGRTHDFAFATTEAGEVFADPETAAVLIATRHNLHADLVIRALRAGKHVLVEKPLAITFEDLARIADCVESLGEACPVLMVGFNRRFTVGMKRLRAFFEGIRPLVVQYRFAVPSLPPDHWVHDPAVGGGRLVGEACHALDACAALTGSVPSRVFAESVAAVGESQVCDDRVFITLRHEDGSISNVSYQAGVDRAFPAERIEITGGNRVATLTGWDQLELWQGGNCKKTRTGNDRGFDAELKAFVDACRHGGEWPIPWEHLYGSAAATLHAALSLRDGLPHTIGQERDTGDPDENS
jgi:predicted dehydrogenase/threonine dehydrogenase-like Zn-dependent dehydrogenase